MKKVKNVIKGYMAKYDIEKLHLIDTQHDEVYFSGDIQKYLNPVESMVQYKKECDERIVINSINHNDVSLFLFI